MKKRLLSTLLALSMVLTLLPGWAGAAEQQTIHVSTVEELRESLKSNTKIILGDGVYNVGNGLCINNLENVTIQGGEKTRIIGSEYMIDDPHYNGVSADIGACLFFFGCKNVTLNGLSIGHDFSFESTSILYRAVGAYCSDVTIVDCNLFGGSFGLDWNGGSIFSERMTVQGGYEYIMSLSGTESAFFKDCTFSDNGADSPTIPAIFGDSESATVVTFDNCKFERNKNGNFLQEQKEEYEQVIWNVKNCTFQNNGWDDSDYQPEKTVVEILDSLLDNTNATSSEIKTSL